MSFAQRVQDLNHTQDAQLTESNGVVELSVVNSDPNTTRLCWDNHQGARIWRSRMLDQTGSETLIESGVHIFWWQLGGCGRVGR